ncbi:hypothetical protein K7103_004195 [Vibrio parahaemolyticus]|nr:hypothetical protein [Vibrio parahaemolyticus]EHY8553050.1 hypothetical protein [Vibrio parahaemolyticus]EIA9327229.1 hypothetical protein [Vibrio parahaemolyticus]
MENQENNLISNIHVGFCNFGSNWVRPTPVTEIIEKLENHVYADNIKSYQEQVAIHGKTSVSKYSYIPLFIPHASYENDRKRKDDNGHWMYDTFELSGIIHADLDGVPTEEFEDVWAKLESTNPLFLFRSPNGGIKCFWVHNMSSTMLSKTLFTKVCRMFVKDTLTKLGIGEYYDYMPTHPNANCFFSAGDGFKLQSNVAVFKPEHVKDLNPYLRDVVLMAKEEKRLEKIINDKLSDMETVGWDELSEERRNKINDKIEKFADQMYHDVITTNSKSKGNNQSYKLACCCKGHGVGYDRTVSELSKFNARFNGATWCPRDKASAAFLGSPMSESFNKVATKIPEELQLSKLKKLISSSERIPTPTFYKERVKLEDANGIITEWINDAIANGEQSLAIEVTPGTGKSEAVKDSAMSIVEAGYKIGIYLDNKRDVRETELDLIRRCPLVRVNEHWSYRTFMSRIQTIKGRESKIDTSQPQPEELKDYDFSLMCHMAKTMRKKSIETAMSGFPALSDYCGKECIYGLCGGGAPCEYLQQMRPDAQIRIYNHSYAHGKKGNFENRDEWVSYRSCGELQVPTDDVIFMTNSSEPAKQYNTPKTAKVISIVDEDIMKDLWAVDCVTTSDLEDIEVKDFKVELLEKFNPEPKDQSKFDELIKAYKDLECKSSKYHQIKLMRKLLSEPRTSEEIAHFVENDLGILFTVYDEIKLNRKMGDFLSGTEKGIRFMKANGLNPNRFKCIMGLNALCKLENYGAFSVVKYHEKCAFQYFRKSKVNLAGMVIQLDGHANEDILNRGYGREFDFKRLSVEMHKDAEIIQVYNSTGSKQALTVQVQSDKNIERTKKKVKAIADKAKECYTIGSKSIEESTGIKFDLTYCSCRGTNSIYNGMLVDGKPLLMVNDYKIHIDAVEGFFRAFYPELGTPNLEYEDGEFVREMKSGVHEKTTGRMFKCPIVQSIYDFLSRSEVEQGMHRARPVRHGSKIVCLFNTVVDFPVSAMIDMNDYLELVDGRGDGAIKRSDAAKNDKIEKIVESMQTKSIAAIMNKPRAFVEHGLTKDQCKNFKPTPELMAQHGLETHEVVLVDAKYNKTKATMFTFPEIDFSQVDFGKKRFKENKLVRATEITF